MVKQSGPLDRFLGNDVRKGIAQHVAISNTIHATWQDIGFAEDSQPEEHGKLYVFPIDEQSFSLQVCYLTYTENATENAMACSIQFLPAFFEHFPESVLQSNPYFSADKNTVLQFSICAQSALLLDKLRAEDASDPFTNVLLQTQFSVGLLTKALESITVPVTVEEVPACRFLAYDSERDKILDACNIIERSEGRPHTIRELSRKVAMNECYLKKGFKALTGKTIHEYQQHIRINKAKEMLQMRGISVTDVALTLGYSSISHFSTAFKRVTGLKPCELLS